MSPRSPFSRRTGPSHLLRDSPLRKASEPLREIIPQVMLKELKPFQNWNYIIPGAFVRGCTQYWCCFCMDTRVQSCKRQMVWHSECNVQFYFPKGPPPSKDTTESCMARVNEIYGAHPEGLPAAGECTEVNPIPLRTGLSRRSSCQWGFEIVAVGANWITQSLHAPQMPCGSLCAAFATVTKDVCKLPSFLSSCLFKKIDVTNTGLVTRWGIFHWLISNCYILVELYCSCSSC